MPVDDKDFYHMQAHMHFQDEKLLKMREEFREDLAEVKNTLIKMESTLQELVNERYQHKGSLRTLAFFAAAGGAILGGIGEYVLYYILQK